jgi:hypothetical protein
MSVVTLTRLNCAVLDVQLRNWIDLLDEGGLFGPK